MQVVIADLTAPGGGIRQRDLTAQEQAAYQAVQAEGAAIGAPRDAARLLVHRHRDAVAALGPTLTADPALITSDLAALPLIAAGLQAGNTPTPAQAALILRLVLRLLSVG